MAQRFTVELPDEAVAVTHFRPDQLPRALREAAVLRWFEEGRVSQGQASYLLGITRGEFFDVLAIHHLSPVQLTTDDLEADFKRV